MPAIQVRNVPPALHDALRDRAAAARVPLSTYVLQVLEREAARPAAREWFDVVSDREPVAGVDVRDMLDQARSLADRRT